MQVLIHAGFHKTGTTSVQNALRQNRARLKPHLRLFLPGKLTALCRAARAYSAERQPMDEGLIRFEAAELAQRWHPDDPRPILISSEDLSGHMPGRKGLTTYDATPQILALIAEAVQLAQPMARLAFHFSTRDPAAWIRSCYVQHLRALRMTEDIVTYTQRMAASADLDDVVDRVARVVAPIPVTRCRLEECTANPLVPILDRLDLPEGISDTLARPAPAFTAPPQAWIDAVLDLNRSALDQAEWKAARAKLHEGDFA